MLNRIINSAKVAQIVCQGFLGVVLMAVAFQAAADVSLNTTVQKVESYLAEDGLRKTRLVPALEIIPGDELKYIVEYTNIGNTAVDKGSVVITDPIPADTIYLSGTAFGSGTEISFSADGGKAFSSERNLQVERNGEVVIARPADYTTIRWEFGPVLEPGQKGYVSFNVVLK
ncbi:MAG: DUF11 domain-containing protein [Pseudomonadales bacterium]|nr:DUF11 domain-containing protein [Pseudomonadales bacterium]